MQRRKNNDPDLTKPNFKPPSGMDISPAMNDPDLTKPNFSPKLNQNLALENLGLNPLAPNKMINTKERLLGAAENLVNYPIKLANIFKQQPFQEKRFAPNTEEARRGALAGDVASFMIPGMAGSAALKGLSYVPKIGEGINALSNIIKSSPWLNNVSNIAKMAGQGGIFSAVHNPNEAGSEFLKGAGTSGLTQAGINLATSQSPLVGLMARLGLGAGLSYATGHNPIYGLAGGAFLPQAAKMLGLSGKNALSAELLEGLEPRDVARANAAAQRLGTTLTPAQASGNYVTAGLEGNLKRTPQGAQLGYRYEQAQQRQQTQAINNMLDSIYKPTKENAEKINNLYTQAYKMNVNPEEIENMKKNPILRDAFASVKNDPAFENIPENNYEFMAEVDRALQRMKKGADPNSAYTIGQVKKQYNTYLKNTNDDYKAATEAAQPKIVRENIERKLNKMDEDVTGKSFYNKFLNTRNSYKEILKDTKNFPQAQQSIKDMRAAWKHLSNMKTVSQGEAQAKTGIADMRDQFKIMSKELEKIAGAKRDIEGLKFINSKDWEKGFDEIAKMKDQKLRNRAFLSLLGKMAVFYGLE